MNETVWRERYEARLLWWGYTPAEAKESAQAAEYIDDVEPDDAADDEVSYGEG